MSDENQGAESASGTDLERAGHAASRRPGTPEWEKAVEETRSSFERAGFDFECHDIDFSDIHADAIYAMAVALDQLYAPVPHTKVNGDPLRGGDGGDVIFTPGAGWKGDPMGDMLPGRDGRIIMRSPEGRDWIVLGPEGACVLGEPVEDGGTVYQAFYDWLYTAGFNAEHPGLAAKRGTIEVNRG